MSFTTLSPKDIGKLYTDYLAGSADGSVWSNFGTFVMSKTPYVCTPDGRYLRDMSDYDVLTALHFHYNNKIGSTTPYTRYDQYNAASDADAYNRIYEEARTQPLFGTSSLSAWILMVVFAILIFGAFVHI